MKRRPPPPDAPHLPPVDDEEAMLARLDAYWNSAEPGHRARTAENVAAEPERSRGVGAA